MMMWSQYDMMSDYRCQLTKDLEEAKFYNWVDEIKEIEQRIKDLDDEMAEFIQEENKVLEND